VLAALCVNKMIEGMKIIVGIILLAVGIPIVFITWFKCAINLFKIWSHVKQEALKAHGFLRFNKFNAIFVPNALDEEGIKARNILLKNTLLFVATVVVVMSYGMWSGLVTT
jgi:hypothetical protein